jgi:hypothetical protein
MGFVNGPVGAIGSAEAVVGAAAVVAACVPVALPSQTDPVLVFAGGNCSSVPGCKLFQFVICGFNPLRSGNEIPLACAM